MRATLVPVRTVAASILYGTVQAGEVVIVEGYFDVIALRAAGVCNAVATMGTAGADVKLRLAAAQARL